jgi:AraC-like DNA-binding protein
VLNLTIRNTSNQRIELLPGFPEGNTSTFLPGGDKWSAEGDFGSILIEEFCAGPFTIRYTIFSLLKKLTAHFRTQSKAICTRIATKNDWQFSLGTSNNIKLKQGHFILYKLNEARERIVFDKGKEYRSFEVISPALTFERLQSHFPELVKFIDSNNLDEYALFPEKPAWAGPQIMDIVRNMPDFRLKDSLREYYCQHRMEELFFLLMALSLKNADPVEDKPTESEIAAVQMVKKIITSDITQHYSIPLLARKVRLNEYRLKHVFKQLNKAGIFEFLQKTRMEEARRLLLQSDLPITEIASRTGYIRITSFITAYRKTFNITPGSVKRELSR